MENGMETGELINQLIYHLSDASNEYQVRIVKDEQEYEFKVDFDDGHIRLVVTD